MTRDRRILYASYISLVFLPFLALLANETHSRWVLALILVPVAIILPFIIKKRTVLAFTRTQVLGIMVAVGILYLSLYYSTGMFYGFGRMGRTFAASLKSYILPLAAIIIAIEIIRTVALAQSRRLVTALSYVTCVISEVLALSNVAAVTNFNRFMDVIGLTLFPALTANLLYHFLSRRYGARPVIAYRLIVTLLPYVIGYLPLFPDSLYSFAKVFFPLLVMLFVNELYDKKRRYASVNKSRFAIPATILTLVVMISIAMLISCQFRFGILVVATESMTDEINKGDAVLYERYDEQKIEVGQVIVFRKQNTLTIHRVVDIQNIDGVTRYITKGDANEDVDGGYITDADIVGLTDIKIPGIGYPTLWLRELFK